ERQGYRRSFFVFSGLISGRCAFTSLADECTLLAQRCLKFRDVDIARLDAAVCGDPSGSTCGVASEPALRNLTHEAVAVGVARDMAASGEQAVETCRHQCA